MQDKINVNIGSFIAVPGHAILESKGLGSSVAVCLYEEEKIGGMVRIMAPKAKKKGLNPLRFADNAINSLLENIRLLGCEKKNLKAKIFGGASMFPSLPKIDAIGKGNVKAVKEKLRKLKIPVIEEDTGGNRGRNIRFDTKNGSVTVKKSI